MTPYRVLVACEFSGVVREAFRARGHDAWSCDLLPTEIPGQHIQGDVLDVLSDGWDLMIAHPPCTHLAVSGARWFKDKQKEQTEALEFVRRLLDAPIPRIALENPVSIISSQIRRPDQIIQPWQFGHGEVKATCLWLKGLPHLKPSQIVDGRTARVHREPPSPDRWKNRSRTYPGIAEAMAAQWLSSPLHAGPRMGALASGPTTNSSPAVTDDRGVLNPAFSLWLQGYRAEWLCCAASGIASCRSARRRSSKPQKKQGTDPHKRGGDFGER